jgi:hypothetical protein
MTEQEKPEDAPRKQDRASELGRAAGRFFKQARPRAKQAFDEAGPQLQHASEDARRRFDEQKPKLEEASRRAQKSLEDHRPQIENAGKGAVRYAKEHEDEIRSAAMWGVRRRFGGPLGMVIESLGRSATRPSGSGAASEPGVECGSCQGVSPANAKFCSQCGARLQPD